MTAEQIVEHNKSIAEKIKSLRKEIKEIDRQVLVPCEYCSYDGVYRCEACAEDYYQGFNIKEYPR